MSSSTWQELLNALTSTAIIGDTFDNTTLKECPKDVIKLCYHNEIHRNHLLDWMKSMHRNQNYLKSEKKARLFRTRGNEKFLLGDNLGSLSLYSESILYAPETSKELPLALANRSAALFHLKCYNECLRDIELSFIKGYPKSLHYKLLMRKTNCLELLNKFELAICSANLAKESFKHAENINESKIAFLSDKLDEFLAIILEKIKDQEIIEENAAEKDSMAVMSPHLEIKYNKLVGRHVITNEDVKIGQILISEIPYALVVLPDHYTEHCHHCCANLTVTIPCWKCTQVLYCNDQCRQQSWDQYHCWECGGLDICHSIGIAHLGLRVALTASPLESLRLKYESLAKTPDEPAGFADQTDGYPEVFRLVSHLEDMTSEDLFQYGCTATMLALFLSNCTDYFQDTNDAKGSHEDIMFVAEVILHHIAQLVCNGHAITKLSTPESCDKVVSVAQVRVATAIYPSVSMLNHSCDSNIVNSFEGHRLYVKASRDISKGEEIFNCYGPHFRHMSRRERKETLKMQYFFDCACVQCTLPDGYDFQERFNGLLCPLCGGPLVKSAIGKKPHLMHCLDCGKKQMVKCLEEESAKADFLFNQGMMEVEAANEKAALGFFRSCLEMQAKCLYRSHRERRACLDMIARCHATIGELEQSAVHLLLALPAIEEQFGEQSTEVANEIQKLTDILLLDLRTKKPSSNSFKLKQKELEQYLERAMKIMALHSGAWDTGMKDIIGKKIELENMIQMKK